MKKLSKVTLGVAATILVAGNAFAQGNDNPTGTAGVFNGQITTGCSYDPYTGNAKRSVTDLVVAGGVGTYPLAFTRTANSRYPVDNITHMGEAGNWLHSYQWSINTQYGGSTKPTSYTVNYPDGRIIKFTAPGSQGNNNSADPYFRSPAGVQDRLQVIWDTTTVGRCYVIQPDGGKIWFSLLRTLYYSNWYMYTATVQGIIDPYGLTTTIVPQTDGSTLVTEPAGRWIRLYYRTISQASEGEIGYVVLDHITSSDGRSVQYNYSAYNGGYTSLVGVTYFGDPSLMASYTYQNDNVDPAGVPLLATCNDPMYAGPMKRLSYTFGGGVSGKLVSENSGTTNEPVSTLTGTTETRADGKTRTFTYSNKLLQSFTDFRGKTTSLTYDAKSYRNSMTDRNGHTTNWTNNSLSGGVMQITYPLTPSDTPSGSPRGTIVYTCGSTTCPDPNNRDANNPYYIYSIKDEGGNITTYLRDTNKRITQINYPDGGTESFTYNSFGQVLTHVLRAGGTETFTYDGRGLKQTYRDPYHATGNPSFWYQHDTLDRLSGETDALGSGPGDINHTTSYTYNSRGQVLVTTHPVDPVDGQRHSVTNVFNSDGTLAGVTDELGNTTSFTYDDYRRLRSVQRPGHNTPVTTYAYYDANGTGDDYTHTDSNLTHVISPGGKTVTATYDENFRRAAVTLGDGTSDAATTSYGYDNAGNMTSIVSPNEQAGQPYAGQSTVATYDERNRIMSVTDPLGNSTTFKYDAAGRKASVTRANAQVTTYDSYDAMNRLLQQTIKQTPDPDAVTKYTYYTSGLLASMQDPRLVANSSIYKYSYAYDQMGRKTGVTYPPDSYSVQRSEAWHYDTVGRIDTFTNRAGNIETVTYDALNRLTGTSWNDNGITPSVTFGYDTASRVTSIVNVNANIARSYFNDNLLNAETSTYVDNTSRTVTYTYNADSKRASVQYPNGAYSFTYDYTGRNQLKTIANTSPSATIMTYAYDLDGNLTTRTPDNGTGSTYTYDAIDRVTNITHALSGTPRTLDYAYDNVNNLKWTKRDGSGGDVFGYDQNDESISVLLNVANPDTTSPGSQTISYDANGNRTSFAAYGTTDTYTSNNLNQYVTRNSSQATYDYNGNMTIGVDGSNYTYDAQNRLLTASTTSGPVDTFTYDGLNRQVSRKIGGASPLYNVYDGWNLIGEYNAGASSPLTAYLQGTGGLVKLMTNSSSFYYYQDGSGSTSHLADNTGHLVEWYRYDLHGTPLFYNSLNTQLSASNYSVRHLFTGQQWYGEVALYDLRYRYYSPDIGRFLQGDPIGFNGDSSNLYRYCQNNPPNGSDVTGLDEGRVTVTGSDPGQPSGGFVSGSFGGGAGSWGFRVRDGGGTYGGLYGGSDAQMAKDSNGDERVLVTGWMDPVSGLFLFGPWQTLGFTTLGGFSSGLQFQGGIFGAAGFGAPGGSRGTEWSFTGGLTDPTDPNAAMAAFGRQFSGYNLTPFADTMDTIAAAYSVGGLGGMAALEGAPLAYENPHVVAAGTDFMRGFFSPGAPPTSLWQSAGAVFRDLLNWFN
jgi:RHS repeat-associated protein